MADHSAIEWTDATWNPIVGCSIVSPGCTNCYAMQMAARIEKMASSPMAANVKVQTHYAGTTQRSKAGAVWTGKVAEAPAHILMQPLKWRRPRKIFVNSMGDLFHESISDEKIDKVFAVMALSPHHTFQVLTKRAERMRAYMSAPDVLARVKASIVKYGNSRGGETEDFEFFASIGWQSRLEPCEPDCVSPCEKVWASDDPNETRTIRRKDFDGVAERACVCYGKILWDGPVAWPLPNVWLGVSAERQQEADERILDLLATPAAVRFVSLEPLLGPIDLEDIQFQESSFGALTGRHRDNKLDWIIVGGESGKNARPMHPEWARSLRDQCAAAGVPFFFKQHGEFHRWEPGLSGEVVHISARDGKCGPNPGFVNGESTPRSDTEPVVRVGKKAAGRLLDGKTHDAFPGEA